MLIYLATRSDLKIFIEHFKKIRAKRQMNNMRMLPDIEAVNNTLHIAAVQIIRIILLFSLHPVQVMNSVFINLWIFIFLMLSYYYVKVILRNKKLRGHTEDISLMQNNKKVIK